MSIINNKIFTSKNHYLGIKDETNSLNYYISPIKLDVGQLQYLADNNKLSIETWKKQGKGKKTNYYLNLGEEYSPINIETNTEIKETQATSSIFYHIVDDFKSKERKIELYLSENESEKSHIKIPINKKKLKSQIINNDTIFKDISYVRTLIEDIKHYLYNTNNIRREYKELFNNIHGNDIYNYNIVEEQKIEFNDGTKETIVYVGYPDMTEMQWLLNKQYINYTNSDLKEKNRNYKQELYNFWKTEQLLYSKNADNKQWDIENSGDINDNYYKMFIEFKNNYSKSFIDPICDNYDISDEERKRVKDYYLNKFRESNLIQNCLNRPNLNIKYIWFIFKKEENIDGIISLKPYFNTIRDLGGDKNKCNKHLKILDTLLIKYIRQKLSEKFNILLESESEYKNYYSYVQYGSIFHIRTDYIHPTQQIDHYTHRLGRSIKLEEILYILDEGNQTDVMVNYWQNIKLEYKFKGRFLLSDKSKKKTIQHNTRNHTISTNKTRKKYNQEQNNNINNINNFNNNNTYQLNNNNTLKSITVLICYSISNKSTHIYLKKNNDYYYMKIIPFLTNIKLSSIEEFKQLQEKGGSAVYKIKIFKKLSGINMLKYSYYKNFSIFPSLFIHGKVDREFEITLPTGKKKNLYNFYSPINISVLKDIKNKSSVSRPDIEYIYSKEIEIESKIFNIIMYRKGLDELKYIIYIFHQNKQISEFLKGGKNDDKELLFYDDKKLISIMTYDNNNNIISLLKEEILNIFYNQQILNIPKTEKNKYRLYINKLSSLNLSCLHFQLIKSDIYKPILNSYYQLINRLLDINNNHNIELYNQYYYKMGLSEYNANMSLKIMFNTLNNI